MAFLFGDMVSYSRFFQEVTEALLSILKASQYSVSCLSLALSVALTIEDGSTYCTHPKYLSDIRQSACACIVSYITCARTKVFHSSAIYFTGCTVDS